MVLFMMMMVTMMPWMPEREPIKPGEFGYYLIVFFWVSEDVTWYYFRPFLPSSNSTGDDMMRLTQLDDFIRE